MKLLQIHCQGHLSFFHSRKDSPRVSTIVKFKETTNFILKCRKQMALASLPLLPSAPMNFQPISALFTPLDLTEENINRALEDAKLELGQLFDTSVGITGKAELAELDGPYVKIRLSGRFWHERSVVLSRLGNYLKHRIPEILEVDIEDEKQLDDSPDNF